VETEEKQSKSKRNRSRPRNDHLRKKEEDRERITQKSATRSEKPRNSSNHALRKEEA
jgi:hypothetical protein